MITQQQANKLKKGDTIFTVDCLDKGWNSIETSRVEWVSKRGDGDVWKVNLNYEVCRFRRFDQEQFPLLHLTRYDAHAQRARGILETLEGDAISLTNDELVAISIIWAHGVYDRSLWGRLSELRCKSDEDVLKSLQSRGIVSCFNGTGLYWVNETYEEEIE